MNGVSDELKGQRVLVTGAAGGIGQESCRCFLEAGARLVMSDRDGEALGASPDEVLAVTADIADAAEVAALFARIESVLGGLDGAFNNAGRGGGEIPLAEIEAELWHDVIAINLTGTFHCMQADLRMMLGQGGGSIVNNGSILGLHGGVNPAYTAAKHGVSGLTKSAALVYSAQGIRVNAVCPGLIEAGLGLKVLSRPSEKVDQYLALHPQGRPGHASEVAQAALWLLSERSSYVTGHLLAVDGGYGCR